MKQAPVQVRRGVGLPVSPGGDTVLPMSAKATRRPLTGKQRRFLRAEAHHLAPVVLVGKEGVTTRLIGAVDEALEAHELIKVRVHETSPVSRAEAGSLLSDALGAHEVGGAGRVLILYRRHAQRPVIRLPGV